MSEEQTTDGSASGPPKPKRVGGWADDGREKGRRRRDTVEEDERLRVPESVEDDDEDLPVIPDLEAVQEEDLTTQIAAPPTLAINRVATYKQLESDLHQHTFTLDGGIDLTLLAKALSPQAEINEDDTVWTWDKLFTEMSSDIQAVWGRKTDSNLPLLGDKTNPDHTPS